MDKRPWIVTASGWQFFPFDPDPKDVFIDDIAHALSNKCRFAGHTREFYSVAQHSIMVSDKMFSDDPMEMTDLALAGLLHDASEAYTFDCPSPILKELKDVKKLQDKITEVIFKRFEIPIHLAFCNAVVTADLRALMTEKRDLIEPHSQSWEIDYRPYSKKIIPVYPEQAKAMFLQNYSLLMKVRGARR